MDQATSSGTETSYVVVTHSSDDPILPTKRYAELDVDGYEMRKVSILRDGRFYFADESASDSYFYGLAEHPYTRDSSERAEAGFSLHAVTQDAFEDIWAHAISVGETVRKE